MFALGGLLTACGADEDAAAPTPADIGRPCPGVDALAPNLTTLLREGRLPAVRRLLGETLDQSQLTAVLDAALRVIRALPGDELTALHDLLASERLAPALELFAGLLDYAATNGPDGGVDAALLGELSALVQHCASGPLYATLDAVLSGPEVLALAEPLRATLAQPEIRALLSEAGALNREHLAAFLCNLQAALIRPGADPGQSIRSLADTVGGLTDLLARPPASTVVEGVIALLSPTGVVFPPVRDLLCCDLYGLPTCPDATAQSTPRVAPPVFVYLAYDVFLQRPETLDAALSLLADRALTDQLAPAVDVLRTLGADPDVRQAVTRLLTTVLDPVVAAELLPELRLLLDVGAWNEALRLVDALLSSCPPTMPGGDL